MTITVSALMMLGMVGLTSGSVNADSDVLASQQNQPVNSTQTVPNDVNDQSTNDESHTPTNSNKNSDNQKQNNVNNQQDHETNNNKSNQSVSQQAETYLQNNEAYDKNSFTGVNNFLTANSWYRPKMIHQNGQSWVPSTPNDYRPVLMNWWPDLSTQYQYLNYMYDNGLLANSPTNGSSLNTLLQSDDQVQDNIERKITQEGNTDWLHSLMSNFVSTIPQWNKGSEDPTSDGLQGGFFTFGNSPLTPNTNSNYRLLSRDPGSDGNGQPSDWTTPNTNHMELLLGNDIDNSNPTVQAEDLNNLYYYTNLCTIFKGNPNANFDGIREDGTYSMDYDVNKLYAQFIHDQHPNTPNNNLTIFEDNPGGSVYGVNSINNAALTQDMIAISWGGLFGSNAMSFPNANTIYANRLNDNTENKAVPNYSTVNKHDNGNIKDGIEHIMYNILSSNPNLSKYDAAEQATHIFDNDRFNVQKQYGEYYGVPARYALMLSNKDTVPTLYYGDMYNADDPYMSSQTPYFAAIKALSEARRKYVAGGQQVTNYDSNSHIISSVRFGKDNSWSDAYGGHQILNKNDDAHTSNDPTTGMAVIINNSTDNSIIPSNGIDVNMGAAHGNQTYYPIIKSTNAGDHEQGLVFNDPERLTTNSQGVLHIPANDLTSTQSPQMIGNLSVWAPTGAASTQDARTFNYPTPSDGKVFHSNAGLDSHVLMEGFSTYLPIIGDDSQRLDNVISKPDNISQLKDWGVTDFRFPPHYAPVTSDNTFADAYMRNGYAFKDRYAVGQNQPTKYGTLDDLLNANITLHNNGIHTLGDFVTNQIYDLPESEVVPVSRTDYNGNYLSNDGIKNALYVDKSMSNPNASNDLQHQYGGKYLSYLQSRYPDLFNESQISTGQKINPNTHITQWSAKYMNGSNIQGRGVGYVLHHNDDNNAPSADDYYIIGQKLPTVFVNGVPHISNGDDSISDTSYDDSINTSANIPTPTPESTDDVTPQNNNHNTKNNPTNNEEEHPNVNHVHTTHLNSNPVNPQPVPTNDINLAMNNINATPDVNTSAQTNVNNNDNNSENTTNVNTVPSVDTSNDTAQGKITSTNKANKPAVKKNVKVVPQYITLKQSYEAHTTNGRRISFPKNYKLTVTNDINKNNKHYYQAKFNHNSVIIPTKYAKVIKYARRSNNAYHNYADNYLRGNRRSFVVLTKKYGYIHNSKHFTKRNRVGHVNAGRYVRVRRIVRDGYTSRLMLNDYQYITGHKAYVRFAK